MSINPISMIEQNIHGAWVVYGLIGVKQYYGYTKAQAKRMYKTEAEKVFFINRQKSALMNFTV